MKKTKNTKTLKRVKRENILEFFRIKTKEDEEAEKEGLNNAQKGTEHRG